MLCLHVRKCHDRIAHNYPGQVAADEFCNDWYLTAPATTTRHQGEAEKTYILSSLCPPWCSDVLNTSLAMARLLPSLLDSSPGQGPGLLLNGFRLFRDRAPTMEAYIWTPSVVTIKFNVKNGVLLKQRETNDFRVINSFVYFYHLKIINRSLVVLASYKIYDK